MSTSLAARVCTVFCVLLVFKCSFILCSRPLQQTEETQETPHHPVEVSLLPSVVPESPGTAWMTFGEWVERLVDHPKPSEVLESEEKTSSDGVIERRVLNAIFQMLPRGPPRPPPGPDPGHN